MRKSQEPAAGTLLLLLLLSSVVLGLSGAGGSSLVDALAEATAMGVVIDPNHRGGEESAESKSESDAAHDFRSISRFFTSEIHPALMASSSDGQQRTTHRQQTTRALQDATGNYLADFDDICEEMRIIFRQQCSCGATAQERSDLVTCQSGSSGGLEASAHFSDTDFALQTVQVCKQQACTMIHYQNRTGTRCEASYGGSSGSNGNDGKTCDSCRVCAASETGGSMMGLEIDCTNVNPDMSVNCTPVSDVLDLSGAGGRSGPGWRRALFVVLAAVGVLVA